MNIPILEVENYEADDIIGTVSLMAEKEGFEVFMMTPDKDYAQLVSENIKMYKPRSRGGGVDVLGPKEVREKFSVPEPINVIDILSLMGDSSDNIPGCPGIGEKGAKDIISKYNDLNGIYENIDDFKGKRKQNLIDFREQVELSYKLATIIRDVPIEVNFDDAILSEPNKNELVPLLEELEFRSLLPKFGLETNKQGGQGKINLFGDSEYEEETVVSNLKTIADVEHNYYLVDNEQAYASLTAELSVQKSFCFDTETTSLNPEEAMLVGIAFAYNEGEAYYVPFPKDEQQAYDLAKRFKYVLEDEKIEKIGQNIKYDIRVLKKYDINVEGKIFDTMVAHNLAFPGIKSSMDAMATAYLNYDPIHIESLIGPKGAKQLNMANLEPVKVKDYAAEDADVTLKLRNYLLPKLKEQKVENIFYDIEMPLLKVLADMENTGVRLDNKALADFSEHLGGRLAKLEEEITSLAGKHFNISSPKQVGEVLFETLKIDAKAKKTKSGQYSTGEEVIIKLKDKHPIVPKILEYRGFKKLLNTYAEALPALINKRTNRIHTTFNQSIVVTGRLSSSNPNLQNIPIRDEEGREIRKAFIPSSPDNVFLSADYSQVELRLMAHFSGDEDMIKAFNNGEDIHAATAAKIYKVDIKEVTSDMRRKAKTANFGIIYGISAFGLSERLNISRSEAKEIIDGYFNSFPKVKEFMDDSIAKARDNGFVETLFGRRRNLPDIDSRNGNVRSMAERNAINAPIQGTAADIIKIAMVQIFNEINLQNLKTKMIIQVHDELNFDVPKNEVEVIKNIVNDKMQNVCKLKVPLTAEIGVGNNWDEAH